uniref:IgGFc_binding domain-containing protein n=1 Tax=Heterorhabditis bacteriophora TaxID=37862 RepID=A0A1I7WWX3_HETBA
MLLELTDYDIFVFLKESFRWSTVLPFLPDNVAWLLIKSSMMLIMAIKLAIRTVYIFVGAGSIFEIFEYTTDGTPYGKPKITSGYAMIKSPGELIYRTTSNQEDVNGQLCFSTYHIRNVFICETTQLNSNLIKITAYCNECLYLSSVHVVHLGPLNSNNEYEYVVMSTNCNFPLYVFARDPVTYKQRYETEVNGVLDKKGLVNGISRLLNIVAPVDNTMCTFPPSLFNIQG